MDENSPEGAAQAAKYFMLLYTYTFTTGNTQPWLEMTEEGCVFCKSVVDNTKEIHDKGDWVDHWDILISRITYAAPVDGYELSAVTLTLSHPGTTTRYKADGSIVQVEGEDDYKLQLGMRYTGGRWTVRQGAKVE
ncbi:hypothetical protein JG540_02640 [Actinomyces weissii]|uniref:DUF6318 domain-containing protein n=2 Tax=Actinomyces weissii TaxID=675090 RepID=A0A7T7S1Z4_9ACTO|nr:hypothetical protein JG540_02640 [Actinomyces weissii]